MYVMNFILLLRNNFLLKTKYFSFLKFVIKRNQVNSFLILMEGRQTDHVKFTHINMKVKDISAGNHGIIKPIHSLRVVCCRRRRQTRVCVCAELACTSLGYHSNATNASNSNSNVKYVRQVTSRRSLRLRIMRPRALLSPVGCPSPCAECAVVSIVAVGYSARLRMTH